MAAPVTVTISAAAVLTAAVVVSAPAAAAPCEPDLARVRATAEQLVELGPREDSTPVADRAAERVAAGLRAIGLEPRSQEIGQVPVPRIAVGSWEIRKALVRNSTNENLWVRFGPEQGEARLLMAHYDSVGRAPGAVDNAASVGLLVELARCLAAEPPPHPVVLAFTGGEERGLIGAHRLAKTLTGLELAVSLDLIGHQVPLALNGLSSAWGRQRLEWLAARVRAAGAEAHAPLIHRMVSRRLPQLERSDHMAFADAGVPGLHLYGRGDERIYLAYHTPLDDMSRVTDPALANAFALAAEIATAAEPLPATGGDLGMWLATPRGPVVVSAQLTRIAEWVAAALALALAIVATVLARRRWSEGGAGLLAVLGGFALAWLAVTAAFWLERRLHGVPLSFAHEALRFEVASLTAAIGIAGFFALLLSLRWPAASGSRYHLAAAALSLIPGVAALLAGLFEIAWLPLGAALAFAVAAVAIDRLPILLLATTVGLALHVPLLDPDLVREAVFHGFYPLWLPLPAYLAAVSLAPWLAVAGILATHLPRARRPARLALALALAAATGGGLFGLLAPEPPCSPEASAVAGLACELARGAGAASF